ncbi:MAG: TolC family protein [Paludibacter sp.]|nr:TolC family protein [Paludibacter sp.]
MSKLESTYLGTILQAVTSAQESFRYAKERYGSGKLSVFEFLQSQSQAQAQEVQAKYNYRMQIKHFRVLYAELIFKF